MHCTFSLNKPFDDASRQTYKSVITSNVYCTLHCLLTSAGSDFPTALKPEADLILKQPNPDSVEIGWSEHNQPALKSLVLNYIGLSDLVNIVLSYTEIIGFT